jgi:hypothetical protein
MRIVNAQGDVMCIERANCGQLDAVVSQGGIELTGSWGSIVCMLCTYLESLEKGD